MIDIFFCFYLLCCISFSWMSFVCKGEFQSALFLMLSVFSVAFKFISIGADFIGLALIMLYIGAIVVLFVFVVLMTGEIGDRNEQLSYFLSFKKTVFIFIAISLFMFTIVSFLDGRGYLKSTWSEKSQSYFDIKAFFDEIFQKHVISFEIIGLLLLSSIIGAICYYEIIYEKNLNNKDSQSAKKQISRSGSLKILKIGFRQGVRWRNGID